MLPCRYDELGNDAVLGNTITIIKELARGKYRKSAGGPIFKAPFTTLVTSRPVAAATLPKGGRLVELLGFTMEAIDSFVTKWFVDDTDKRDSLMRQLAEKPNIRGLA